MKCVSAADRGFASVAVIIFAGLTSSYPYSAAHAAAASGSEVIKAPCSSSDSKIDPFRKCTEVIPEFNTRLDERVKEQVKGLYEGRSIDPSDSSEGCSTTTNANEQGSCTGASGTYSFVKPVCSVSANAFSDEKPEITSNHLAHSCGARIQIHVSNSASKITYDLRGANGTREIGYYGGAFVQSIACYKEQVKKEVVDSNSILKTSSDCQALAKDLAGLSKDYGTISGALTEKTVSGDFKDQKNISDIWNCKKDWDTSKKEDGTVDAGPLRQSAQHLCASRAALESMFNQLMVCEVFARASNDFLGFFGDLDHFRDKIDGTVGKKCNQQCNTECQKKCRSKCKKYAKKGRVGKAKSCAKSCAGTCGTSCGNKCYETELVPFLQDQLKRWPNSGSCPL
ncbi:MAG: hypothetical protein A2X94_17120 [Bdellovibrionales bacterium GWB1_55_8]|nr:MAG: hypothetical protein A2X94_17120 [Bdellovibrionales bacterium GWB1_55_8]